METVFSVWFALQPKKSFLQITLCEVQAEFKEKVDHRVYSIVNAEYGVQKTSNLDLSAQDILLKIDFKSLNKIRRILTVYVNGELV